MTELKKTLGFLPLIALGVAGVIGSSWIYTNSAFFEQYGAGGMIFGLAIGTLLAACVALAVGSAGASSVDVKVPFAFVVHGQTLPAGRYVVNDDSGVVQIRGENGNHNVV